MQRLIAALMEKYHPEALIVYGSYADGSSNAGSDFDALLIAPGAPRHDASRIDGVQLDVWLYPPETFDAPFDPEDFVQVFDGIIIRDERGTAKRLQECVRQHLADKPRKTDAELAQEKAWCGKMLQRMLRGDAEGFYRWHWLLTDSLEIACDLRHVPYLGAKKAIRTMAKDDPEGHRRYSRALREFSAEALTAWVEYLMAL